MLIDSVVTQFCKKQEIYYEVSDRSTAYKPVAASSTKTATPPEDDGQPITGQLCSADEINAVIAERYQTDRDLVASAIVIGTLASLVSIPLVLLYTGA